MSRPKGSKNKPKVVTQDIPVKKKATATKVVEKSKNKTVLKAAPVEPPAQPKKKIIKEVPPAEELPAEKEQRSGPLYLEANLSAIGLDRHPFYRCASIVTAALTHQKLVDLAKIANDEGDSLEMHIIKKMLKNVNIDRLNTEEIIEKIKRFQPAVGKLFYRVKL